MRKVRTIGVAAVALVALGVFAGSALAAPESGWLVNAAGALTEVSVTTTGLLFLLNLVLGVTVVRLDCEGTFDGTVGSPEGTRFDLVTAVLNSLGEEVTAAKPLSCNTEVSSAGVCGATGSLAEVVPVNLPWLTEVVLNGTTFEDDFPTTSGYAVTCSNGHKNECTGLALATLTNEATDVLGTFTATTNEQGCTEGVGHVEGSGLTATTNSETLAVSEGE